MHRFVVHRPQQAAMERLLAAHTFDSVGTILRLAWLAGLLRSEIVELTWDCVSFLNEEIRLPDRSVPLPPELVSHLAELSERQSRRSDHVLLSDRLHKPLQPQPVSFLARTALDAEGQTEVRLLDLRHDFIIRQLEQNDWQYVSRITGTEAATLKLHFASYLPDRPFSTRVTPEAGQEVDEFRLWKLLQNEGASAVGLTLRLTWQAGLPLSEIAGLTWGQIDLKRRTLAAAAGPVPLPQELCGLLGAVPDRPPRENVVLSPVSRRPLPADRLSKMARGAMVQAGIDNLTLRDLRMDYELRTGGEERILRCAGQNGYITRNGLMELLHVSRGTAYHRLTQLTARGRLTRIGTRYYPAGAVARPEQQRQLILDYLAREGVAYRQDIAALLHICPSQCSVILRRMVEGGEIGHEKQRYFPKGA